MTGGEIPTVGRKSTADIPSSREMPVSDRQSWVALQQWGMQV